MKNSFASIEAFIALLAGAVAFSSILHLLSAGEAQTPFSTLYGFQLAQDFLEVSMRDPALRENIISFSKGDAFAANALEEKYSLLLQKLGDYCLELEASEKKLQVNCAGTPSLLVGGQRLFFDPPTNGFFEVRITLGFYS
ncbi:TPA: hypothetical protein HA244_06620 [Candidatus Micrarchaeota archaeon]|nr:hypothetical protein [Candidatus Micrarchaeota archaeon]